MAVILPDSREDKTPEGKRNAAKIVASVMAIQSVNCHRLANQCLRYYLGLTKTEEY